MSLSKSDEKIFKVLQMLKLDVLKNAMLTHDNIASIAIKAMRECSKMKELTGSDKKETVVNLLMLLIKEHSELDLTCIELDNMIQTLYDVGVVAKKKCCF
jgi:hypothetical protein